MVKLYLQTIMLQIISRVDIWSTDEILVLRDLAQMPLINAHAEVISKL